MCHKSCLCAFHLCLVFKRYPNTKFKCETVQLTTCILKLSCLWKCIEYMNMDNKTLRHTAFVCKSSLLTFKSFPRQSKSFTCHRNSFLRHSNSHSLQSNSFPRNSNSQSRHSKSFPRNSNSHSRQSNSFQRHSISDFRHSPSVPRHSDSFPRYSNSFHDIATRFPWLASIHRTE